MLILLGWIGCVILLIKGLELLLRRGGSQRSVTVLGLISIGAALVFGTWIYVQSRAMLSSFETKPTSSATGQADLAPLKEGGSGEHKRACTGPTMPECHRRAQAEFRACISLSYPTAPATDYCKKLMDQEYNQCRSERNCVD